MMRYAIVQGGASRSFPDGDPFLAGAVSSDEADVLICLAGAPYVPDTGRRAVLIELGTECLGVHTGEGLGREGGNVVGFARYRNGDDAPSQLVEIVRQPATEEAAIAAAREVLEGAGFTTALCSDQAGRIIDRLVRPKYNAALRLLDEGLATQPDMDLTCRLGLGYADGPVERVVRGGLAHHYDVTRALAEIYEGAGFAPARRAVVAGKRREAQP